MDVTLHFVDYIVMAIFVAISLSIGLYYGLCTKQQTTEHYLFGDRHLHVLPVALSLAVTYQSAISVLGMPAEIYMYHTMGVYTTVGVVLAITVQALFIAPFVHPLKLTSAYEYLGRRYDSRCVQLLGSCLGMLQTLLYMATVLYSPALALEAVADIPLWLSVVLIGVIGTLYTSMGGIKSVIWTDVFQFIVLYGGMIGVFVIGLNKVGGFSGMIRESSEADRIVFDITDPDPRVRHSVWSCLIGGFFMWLPSCCNQSAVQRMCSVKTKRESQMLVLLNVPLDIIFVGTLTLFGLMLFAYYRITECDPVKAGYVESANQVVPYFVMMVLKDVPGLAGIFIAALFSGSLSSLSSGINAMAANTLQDVLIGWTRHCSQRTKTLIAKALVFVYGGLSVGLAYLAQYLPGPVTQGPNLVVYLLRYLWQSIKSKKIMITRAWLVAICYQISNTCFGATGGPVAGIMFLGAICPQANKIGALTGGIIGIMLNMWVAMGSFLYGQRTPMSEFNPISGCVRTNGTDSITDLSTNASTVSSYIPTEMNEVSSQSLDHLALYDISYLYFGLLGFVTSFLVGIIVSILTTAFKLGHPNISPFGTGLIAVKLSTSSSEKNDKRLQSLNNGMLHYNEQVNGQLKQKNGIYHPIPEDCLM